MPPVLDSGGAVVLCGLAPLGAQAVQGGRDGEDHQRDQEVQVDDDQAPEAVEVPALVLQAQVLGQDTRVAEGGDEREGQRDAAEVGEDAGRGEDRLTQGAEAGGHHGLGERQSEDGRDARGDRGQLDAADQGGEVGALERVGQVGRRVRGGAGRLVLDGEGAVQHGQGGDAEGDRDEDEQREHGEPAGGAAPPPGSGGGGRHVGLGLGEDGGHPETALPQPCARTVLALACWASVGKLGVPETAGSLAAAVLSRVPAVCMAVIRAGRA